MKLCMRERCATSSVAANSIDLSGQEADATETNAVGEDDCPLSTFKPLSSEEKG